MSSIFESSPAAATWPRYQHVIFDCDSTLCAIEGIDELSEQPQTREQIVNLTNAAMDGEVPLDKIYGERLSLIAPTRQAVKDLAVKYRSKMVADAGRVVSTLLDAGREVYIVSGGLIEPVREFGVSLGIKASNIHAVDIEYDQLGEQWWCRDLLSGGGDDQSRYLAYRYSELAISDGKDRIIQHLLAGKGGASMLVGDGVSDLLARNSVDLFVGFGGVVCREQVRNTAPVYLLTSSLLPVLALALGHNDFYKLDSALQEEVLAVVRNQQPVFNRQVLANHFSQSFLRH